MLILRNPAICGIIARIHSVAVVGDAVRLGFVPRDALCNTVIEKKRKDLKPAFSDAYDQRRRVVLQRGTGSTLKVITDVTPPLKNDMDDYESLW